MKEDPELAMLYCRLCLAELDESMSFINVMANDRQIHDKITKLFDFTFDEECDLSPFICVSCNNRIESTSHFIDSVRNNQEKLKKTKVTDDSQAGRLSNVVKQESVDVDYDEKILQFPPMECIDVKIEDSGSEKIQRKRKRKKIVIEDAYLCDICSKSFSSKYLLRTHMTSKHVSNPILKYECETCGKQFKSANALANHKVYHEEPADISQYLVCDLCEGRLTFETFEILSDHYREKHNTRGYVKCCSRKMFTKRSVVYHTKFHLRPADFMCSVCQRLFPNKYNLRDHEKRHRPDEERQFQCPLCPKRFHIQYDVKTHMRHVHERNDRKDEVFCVECNKTFASKLSLYLHKRRFHMNLALPMCESCGKQCRSKADLRSHIRARHTDTPMSTCNICGNVVKDLKKHMKIHYESQLNIKCDICGHETTTFKYLRLHMKIHTDEKPYVCSTCGQSFKRKKALNDHMSLHSGIPRHFCNYCDRTFNNSGNKFKHMKQAHPIETEKNRRNRSLKLKSEIQANVVEPVMIQYEVRIEQK